MLAVWTIAPLLLCPSNELDGSLFLLVNLTNSSSIHSQTTLSIALLNLRNRLLLWYLNLLQIFLTTKQMLLIRLVLPFLLLTHYSQSFRPFYSFTDKCSRRSSILGSPVAVLSSFQCLDDRIAVSRWQKCWQRRTVLTCILLTSLMDPHPPLMAGFINNSHCKLATLSQSKKPLAGSTMY